MIIFKDFEVEQTYIETLKELNAFFQQKSIRIVSVETRGGGSVSKDSEVTYPEFFRVWYELTGLL